MVDRSIEPDLSSFIGRTPCLIETKPEALPADNATEWRLVRKIIGNREAAHVTDSGVRSARILRYVKIADLEAMAAEFGIADEDVEKRLRRLVEEEEGLFIKKPEGAYKNVVQVNRVDVLNGGRA